MDEKLLEKIKKMPKIELHLHLDGSLNTDYVKEKYNLNKKQIKEKMIADEKCKNLNDYLTKFNFPISIMQTRKELEDATIGLLNTLKSQNVIYAEIRFAPQFHITKGLNQEEVVQTVLDAMKKVDIKSNLILCTMRGKDNIELNYETINIAKKYLGEGVCAIDLAGAEALFKTEKYQEMFEYIKRLGIPFTIHAGEADGPSSINSAISFGAKRIGHGVRSIEDDKVLKSIIQNDIVLEVCLTSNIQTCICDDFSTHPIIQLYKTGVRVTLNTDNMTVSNTSLENEYYNLLNYTELTFEDLIKMNKNSAKAAFLKEEDKQNLLKKIYEYEKL